MAKRILPLLIICSLVLATVFAFEWPQDTIDSKSISSYFGQKMGKSISSSFIFTNPEEIHSIDSGKILIVMTDDPEEITLFPSTLGTAVIVEHEDKLLSVYGNLDRESVEKNIGSQKELSSNQIIGYTGNSGWQKNRSNLEFQMIDTKNKNSVNPKIFMPRTNNEIPLVISNIVAINRNGDKFYLDSTRNFESGIYKIYETKNSIATPYRTIITINGVVLDTITYDTINVENNKLYVEGKKKYTSQDIYPENNLHLLGEAMFSPGKSTLGLEIEDFLGNTRKLNYIIQIH